MPGTSYSSVSALEIAERRASVRAQITPPIYVNLDNLNGGLVFNINEDGLALTAALDLPDAGFVTMRILLPDSEGWIEARGAIAWRGSSKKEGGVRFVGLAEEARRRISDWIAAEASQWESQERKDAGAGLPVVAEGSSQGPNWTVPETPSEEFRAEKEIGAQRPQGRDRARQRLKDWIFRVAPPGEISVAENEPFEKEQSVVDIASVRASNSAVLEIANSEVIAEEQGVGAPADSVTCLETKMALAKPSPQHALVKSDNFASPRAAPEASERRVQIRTRINPPIYVNLDNVNGGLAFNMSEVGLALTAARSMDGNHPVILRIQIPHAEGWVEVGGQVAWKSESGKTAGITFIGIPEDARRRIKDWLASETLSSEVPLKKRTPAKPKQQPSGETANEKPMAVLPEILKANSLVEKRMLEAILSEDRLALSPLAPPEIRRIELPAAADVSNEVGPPRLKRRKFRREEKPAFHGSRIPTEKLTRLASALALIVATAAGFGRIAIRPGVRNHAAALIAEKTEGTNTPPELKASRLANKIASNFASQAEDKSSQTRAFEPTSTNGRTPGPAKVSGTARPPVRDIEHPAAKSIVKSLLHGTAGSLMKNKAAKLPDRNVVATPIPSVESTRNQIAESFPSHPTETAPAPAKNLPTSVASGTALADAKEKEGAAPALEQPAAAPIGSVSVSADPYPSIRIPQEVSSQKQTGARSLLIGHVISRLEPVYPEDAKHDGIAGTVKLHIVVGSDGTVQSVEPISGPSSLAKAAMGAVREWRYAQTLLGGQPVETEQDIVVKFRLAGQSIPKN
ncbi:MAG TPA: TonB family protein [Candidatus Acidoferrum sp.]|nr:TonB family protein [Candidatus Acidoferrum sp.]